MSFTIKDNTSTSGTTSNTASHMNNVANGDNLFCAIAVNQSSATRVVSVTDSAGNTWLRAGGYAGTNIGVELWYTLNATVNNGTGFTVTCQSGDVFAACIFSSTGQGTSNSYDSGAAVGNNGIGTSLSTGSGATTQKAVSFVLSVNGQANNRAWGNGAGYTNITSNGNGASAGVMIQYLATSSVGAQSATATLDISSNWVAGLFVFADSAITAFIAPKSPNINQAVNRASNY